MKKMNLVLWGLFVMASALFYSCDKDDSDGEELYSISGTTWIYSDEADGGKNTFVFTNEEVVSFTQEWTDTGVDYSETKDGSYVYSHPSVNILVDSKEYAGTIEGETMIIGGFVYNKQ